MNFPISATPGRMGRPPMNVKPMIVRLGEDVPDRIDAVLEPKEKRADLIREAVAATRWNYPDVPALGMISFVDGRKVHHKRDPGRCYIKAGFHHVGESKDGKLCFQLLPDEMPAARPPNGAQLTFA